MADETVVNPPVAADRVPRPGSHKIAVGALGGSITLVLVWLLNTHLGAGITPEVAQSITIIATGLLSIMVPDDMESP